MSLATLVEGRAQTPSAQTSFKNQIDRRRVDFVSVDPEDLRVHLAIEVDDRTHKAEQRRRRDGLVEDVRQRTEVRPFQVRHSFPCVSFRTLPGNGTGTATNQYLNLAFPFHGFGFLVSNFGFIHLGFEFRYLAVSLEGVLRTDRLPASAAAAADSPGDASAGRQSASRAPRSASSTLVTRRKRWPAHGSAPYALSCR